MRDMEYFFFLSIKTKKELHLEELVQSQTQLTIKVDKKYRLDSSFTKLDCVEPV